ncbi:MAG: translational GTPase TypA [Phycisphaerales bacterium]
MLLRNVAIIAHVDHGKTTLVDQLLYQSGMFRSETLDKLAGGQHGLIMDSNDLERERGITILSKNCAVTYVPDDGSEPVRINIVDTPGHADFGGEVERVLRMADGCLLLVDAAEGPMPQTRFVLGKAIAAGLEPVVVINKCDRQDADPQRVIGEVFDLLVDLGADDHALDFPVVYASGRSGWATIDADEADELVAGEKTGDLRPVFDTIIKHVPPASGNPAAPLQMLVITLDYNEYVGRIGIGRVFNGVVKTGQRVAVIDRTGKQRTAKIAQVKAFEGLTRKDVDEVRAGDLCALIGVEGIDIGDTIADPANAVALPPVTIDEPTLTMVFRVNDSPFAGREGKYVTSRQIRDRLARECEHNVALKVDFEGGSGDEFVVMGRGMLHLGVLIETMRREGFELSIGKPKVVLKEIGGKPHEPMERLVVDCPAGAVGAVMESVGLRKGELKSMDPRGEMTHMVFEIPARGLIGLRSRLLTASQGEAIVHHAFDRFVPLVGEIGGRQQGVLICLEGGTVTAYSMEGLADRGVLFVRPQENVYEGQVIGEHNRENDLTVNITRAKQMTNFREATKEAFSKLKASRLMDLEQCLEYIEDDELVEVTPTSVRIRKRLLKENDRKRDSRSKKDREKTTVGI